MSNAINPETSFPSTPDISALHTMHQPIVMVTKVLQEGAGAKRKDLLVINGGKNMEVDQILALQDSLPDTSIFKNGGPGLYHFEVTDKGSAAKVTWRVRLGAMEEDPATVAQAQAQPQLPMRMPTDVSGRPIGSAPARPVLAPMAPAAPPPSSPSIEHLGNGYYYHTMLKTLTDPLGRIYPWSPGQPLPTDLNTASPMTALASAPTAPAATPFPGANPEVTELRNQLTAMQSALAKSEDQRREELRQRELEQERVNHEKQLAQIRDASERQLGELREMIKAMQQRPEVDPETARLRQEIESLRHANEASMSDRKFEALAGAIRDLAVANNTRGPDPMIATLTQLMQQQGSAANEQIRTLREIFSSQLSAAQMTAMTPDKLLSVVHDLTERMNGGVNGVLNEKVTSALGGLLDLALRFQQAQGGGNDNGSPWIGVIERLVDQGGQAVSMIAQATARKANAETAKANATAIQAKAQVELSRQRPGTAAPALPASRPAQAAADEATPPATLEDGRAALAAAMDRGSQAKPKPEAQVIPLPTATAAADAPAAASAAPAAAAAPTAKRRGRRPGVSPLANVTIEELRETFNQVEDETFFGPFMPYIAGFRDDYAKAPQNFSADDVATSLFDAQPFFTQILTEGKTKTPPIALDLLVHGQYAYIFERILPEVGEAFWKEAAELFGVKMAAARESQ
jgi:hypothetical protein